MSNKGKAAMSVRADTERDIENCWETPFEIVDRVRAIFGGEIALDPCTSKANPCKATRFYTPPDDGILLPWDAPTIYVNPPYGATIKHWVEKAAFAAHAYGSKVIMLAPARMDARWFQQALRDVDEVLFYRGRIRFRHAVTQEDSGAGKFASVFLAFNVSLQPMADLGTIMRVHEPAQAA